MRVCVQRIRSNQRAESYDYQVFGQFFLFLFYFSQELAFRTCSSYSGWLHRKWILFVHVVDFVMNFFFFFYKKNISTAFSVALAMTGEWPQV